MYLNKHLKLHMNIIVSDNFSLIKSAKNHFLYLKFKSHSLRKSDTFQYGLEIEKIDFSETLPIFNLYRVMNTNVKNLAICLTVSMATTIF